MAKDMTLKPCPFCGGEPMMVDLHHPGANSWMVECHQCTATHWSTRSTMASAAELWNRRHDIKCGVENGG